MKTKILVGLTLFFCFAFVVSVFSASMIINSMKPPVKYINLTTSEVAKHNSASDCWMIIDGNVYNVTSYINSHPGGRRAVISSCGTDATQAFDTKGGRGDGHSASAHALLASFLVAALGQTVPR